MPRENETNREKYLCSNPNCRNIFSRPKVITYHVCPDCQTLVTINEFADEEEIQIVLAAKEPTERNPKVHESKDLPKQNPLAPETKNPLIEKNSETKSKVEERKEPNTLEQEAKIEQISLSAKETGVPNQTPQAVTFEADKPPSHPTGCQYGFGYLSQREKGEGIPDGCIECAQSLSCMLSEYYKAEKSVKEIKKWYGF